MAFSEQPFDGLIVGWGLQTPTGCLLLNPSEIWFEAFVTPDRSTAFLS